MGNGDGMVSGSPQLRIADQPPHAGAWRLQTQLVCCDQAWHGKEVMGDYLPYVLNLKTKARFEALGCPVDKSKLWAMLPK